MDISTISISFVIAVLTTVILVFILGKKSFFTELQISVGIISLILFFIMYLGLYFGYGIKKAQFKDLKEQIIDYLKTRKLKADLSTLSGVDGVAGLLGEGLIGVIIIFVLGILVAGIFILLFVFLIEYMVGIVAGIFIFINFIIYISLKKVFKYSIICKGSFLKSLIYSTKYTVLYSGWIFVIIWIMKYKLWKLVWHI